MSRPRRTRLNTLALAVVIAAVALFQSFSDRPASSCDSQGCLRPDVSRPITALLQPAFAR
jgi:hypothetical protein